MLVVIYRCIFFFFLTKSHSKIFALAVLLSRNALQQALHTKASSPHSDLSAS